LSTRDSSSSGRAISAIRCACSSGEPKILCHRLTPMPGGAGLASGSAAGSGAGSRGSSRLGRAGRTGRRCVSAPSSDFAGAGGLGLRGGGAAARLLTASRSGADSVTVRDGAGGGAGGGDGGGWIPKSAARLSQPMGLALGRAGGRSAAALRRGGSSCPVCAGAGEKGAATGSGGASAPSSRASSSHFDFFSWFSIVAICSTRSGSFCDWSSMPLDSCFQSQKHPDPFLAFGLANPQAAPTV
jgi:hypothetical protein